MIDEDMRVNPFEYKVNQVLNELEEPIKLVLNTANQERFIISSPKDEIIHHMEASLRLMPTTKVKEYNEKHFLLLCIALYAGEEKNLENVLTNIKNVLVSKNKKYGDSALNPIRIFSSATKYEQIRVRIDDKLSRLRNKQLDEDEDVLLDLIGYLILLQIAESDV
jgi:hypothetical protein